MTPMTERRFEQEHQNSAARKYAYDFDYVLRRYMLRTFSRFMRPGATLEMGCYKGEFTSLLVDAGAKVTVIEAAADLVEEVRGRLGDKVELIHSTFEQVRLERRFDNIFLMHTLEHLDDPVGVLRRIDGWLAPGGLLFLVVPNAGLISHNDAVTPAEFAHGHRRTYRFDTLEAEARASGLQVVQRGGVFFKPLANFQFDKLMGTEVMSEGYLEGCYQLGMQYPELCASIYLLCERSKSA